MKTGRPIEVPGIRYQDGKVFEMWPSPRGAHSWMPMAFSPQTGLVYIPRLSQGLTFDSRGIDAENLRVVGANIGAAKPNPLDETSALIAWNPVTQKLVWEVPTFGGWNGGVLATSAAIWSSRGRSMAGSAPTRRATAKSYAVWGAGCAARSTDQLYGRRQAICVGHHRHDGHGGDRSPGSRRLDVRLSDPEAAGAHPFALDSNTELPPAPPPVIQAAPDPDYKPDTALAAKGAATFGFNCGICHGPEAVSGGTAPDLRSSDIPSVADIFHAVVHDGTRVAEGMPSFKDLTESDIAAIGQYIRSRAADLRDGKATVPTAEARGG